MLKAKNILISLTVKRKAAQVLKRSNQIKFLNDRNFIPTKQHNPKYIFSSRLLPRLDQVILYFILIFFLN